MVEVLLIIIIINCDFVGVECFVLIFLYCSEYKFFDLIEVFEIL